MGCWPGGGVFGGADHVDTIGVGIDGGLGRSGICGGGGIIDTDGGAIGTDGGIIDDADGGCGTSLFCSTIESGGCGSLTSAVSQRVPQLVQNTAPSRISLPHLLHVIILLLMPFLCGRDDPAPM